MRGRCSLLGALSVDSLPVTLSFVRFWNGLFLEFCLCFSALLVFRGGVPFTSFLNLLRNKDHPHVFELLEGAEVCNPRATRRRSCRTFFNALVLRRLTHSTASQRGPWLWFHTMTEDGFVRRVEQGPMPREELFRLFAGDHRRPEARG